MTAPLTPPDCDLTDFGFMPLDVARLFSSSFHARATDGEWRAGVTLWAKSWHQVPAASLPNDDVELARLAEFGRDVRAWRKVREGALRGWILADDGLLYHPVVAEKALEAWLEKLAQRLSSGAGNAKRWGTMFDPAPVHTAIDSAASLLAALDPQSRALAKAARRKVPKGSDGTAASNPDKASSEVPSGSQETGTGTGIYSDTDVSGAEPPSIDPEKKAWDDAVSLLTTAGRMKPGPARGFIGKLKADHGIDAKDLLPAIGQAIANGTQDPAAYLRKAAEGIGQRRAGGSAPPTKPDEIGRYDWIRRVCMFRKDGMWLGSWGPRPGERGCICPPDLLEG